LVLATHRVGRYGISCVYQKQCGFVLADVKNIQQQMFELIRVIKDTALDPNAGKARFVTSTVPLIQAAKLMWV
jgi:N terminus of Rad21 / Rec8 like protein